MGFSLQFMKLHFNEGCTALNVWYYLSKFLAFLETYCELIYHGLTNKRGKIYGNQADTCLGRSSGMGEIIITIIAYCMYPTLSSKLKAAYLPPLCIFTVAL